MDKAYPCKEHRASANAQTLLGTKELIINMNPTNRTTGRGQAFSHDASLAAAREFVGEGSPVNGTVGGSPPGRARITVSITKFTLEEKLWK